MNKSMHNIVALLERMAPTRAPILFVGEEGVGKSFYARFVHEKGKNGEAPFTPLSASAVHSELLSSLLVQKTETIFFDEIGDLSLPMQKKLLSLCAEFPVRVLASTSGNLEELTEKKQFLPELYSLLSSVTVFIPPLRQRSAEIVPLAMSFLEQNNQQLGKNYAGFTNAALEMLLSYSWPGNIRELEETVKSGCYVAPRSYIDENDLRLNIKVLSVDAVSEERSLKKAVDRFKKQYISQVLAETRWNQTAAAKILDIQRTYLSRLLKELDL